MDNQASFNTANTLANLYAQWNTVQDSKNMESVMSDECKRKYHIKLLKTREDLLKQLKQHREKLHNLLSKMNSFLENIRAIYYLGLVSNGNSTPINDSMSEGVELEPVIFTTWPTEKFIQTIQLILSN